MQPITYLFFNTESRAAMTRYGEIFGATPEIMPFAAIPDEDKAHMPGVPDDAVMHAALKVGEGWIYASDDIMGGSPEMAGCSITVDLPDVARARAVFDALAEHGQIHMEFEKTFWSEGFGTLTDRYGTRWMVGVEAPMPDQPQT